jgi:serine/threonine protein kinase
MAKYQNISLIGNGGFGEVYLSKRDSDGQVFAKKILYQYADDEALRRFMREVRILSTLDHPNIVRVVSKRLINAPYFYIMPLYKHSLRAELPALIGDENRIYSIFLALLSALEYAHSQGVLHRDLKPENVLMNSDTDIVISDFGLGRIIDSESTRQTLTGFSMGTVLYMAPEQLLDAKRADERSDIFSLGRMLYEMYTGPLTSAVQDTSLLPPGIALIINRCTAQEPERRYQSVEQLKQAWLTLFDSKQRKSAIEEFLFIRTQLAVPGPHDNELIERFIELFMGQSEDSDLIHDTIMQVDPTAIEEMYGLRPEETRQLLTKFADFTSDQSWPFAYTDSIGNRCRVLYNSIKDAQIRAALINCVMIVGVNHNRWHVLGIFSELINGPNEPGEELALSHLLASADDWTLRNAAEYVQIKKLPQMLLGYFAKYMEEE